ncbi:MAG TPA: amidohydrolase family protein [Acidimicrobiia bacterium]|nr:amidohydrolase family protein [Acidimicrobiia bacterium]
MAPCDDDPGLPVKFGPCSNGEFDPQPLSPVVSETIRRARADCDRNARRTGMSRRTFLRSLCGVATTLLALNACSGEATRASKRRRPGGHFDVPSSAATDPDAARAALAGDEFVFDVQGHFLDYTVTPPSREGRDFWTGFPQRNCGEADGRRCFSIERFLQEVFLESDTSMIVLSGLPIAPEGSPQSTALMDEARRVAESLCHDPRVLLQAQALPNVGDLAANLDAMAAVVDAYPVVAWKVFTNYPDLYDGSGNAWRLDDGDPALPPVGNAFVEQAKALGVRVITAHKGLSTTLGYTSRHASPADLGPAARSHPDVAFVAYHSGWETDVAEGPYDPAHANVGVNRLITSMVSAGVGPNENVYAELGTTWWSLFKDPDQAAHLLGKLLRYVGEDNVLWGTDSVFYGSPQDQIQAFRAFRIGEEFQDRYGYPALTDEVKRKILGLNALRLHDVDPVTAKCRFTREELEAVRRTLPTTFETHGPRERAELRAFVDEERRLSARR